MEAQAANPPAASGKIQPCSDAGLENFLADVPNETERNNAIVALGHLMQAQPDGFGAHLAAALLAHAHVMRSTSDRVEKAIKEGSPEAIARALTDVKEATQTVPRLTFLLNAGALALTAALGIGLGVALTFWWKAGQDRALEQRTEFQLTRDLKTIGASLDYDVTKDGRTITITIQPGKAWKLRPPAQGLENADQAEVVLYDPRR